MIEQPKQTPYCCGQESKWVNPTLNLAYFYCEKCKKEVVESEGLEEEKTLNWWVANGSASAILPSGLGTSPFKIGDKVRFEYDIYSSIGAPVVKTTVQSIGYIKSIYKQSCSVVDLKSGFAVSRFTHELTLVP